MINRLIMWTIGYLLVVIGLFHILSDMDSYSFWVGVVAVIAGTWTCIMIALEGKEDVILP